MVKKVLFIEDDPLMSRMYGRIFAARGYSVQEANDGEEGLKKARDFKPDVILLDIMMPKLNGFEVLERLKNHNDTKDIKIVLLTNLGVQSEIDKALTKGVVKFLTKSEQDPPKVVDVIDEILNEKTE